jgi:hypothetical protein
MAAYFPALRCACRSAKAAFSAAQPALSAAQPAPSGWPVPALGLLKHPRVPNPVGQWHKIDGESVQQVDLVYKIPFDVGHNRPINLLDLRDYRFYAARYHTLVSTHTHPTA